MYIVVGPRKRRYRKAVTIFGVEIPEGFETDGASVPRLFHWFISPFGKLYDAAVVHDYRYTFKDLPRWVADLEFLINCLRICIRLHDPKMIFPCFMAYFAVALIGWIPYYDLNDWFNRNEAD